MAKPRTSNPSTNRYRPAPDVVFRRLDEKTVLVNLQTNRIFELNRTGARLWELLEEAPTEEQIVAQLFSEFDVSEKQLAQEVHALTDLLVREGLVERETRAA